MMNVMTVQAHQMVLPWQIIVELVIQIPLMIVLRTVPVYGVAAHMMTCVVYVMQILPMTVYRIVP